MHIKKIKHLSTNLLNKLYPFFLNPLKCFFNPSLGPKHFSFCLFVVALSFINGAFQTLFVYLNKDFLTYTLQFNSAINKGVSNEAITLKKKLFLVMLYSLLTSCAW